MLKKTFRIIDLSKEIYDGMDVYPGDPEVVINVVHEIDTHGWQLRSLNLGSHTGTHVDAFSHMDISGKNLSQMPLEHFIGYAVRVDECSDLPENMGLIFDCEMDDELFEKVLSAMPPFVASQMCEKYERELLKAGIATYTTLVNTDQLPKNEKFLFVGLPLKIRNGDGSPVRAVALVDVM